jgi:hypothetical protein
MQGQVQENCCSCTGSSSYLDNLPAPYTQGIDAAVGILYCCIVYVHGRSTAHDLRAMLQFTCGTGKQCLCARRSDCTIDGMIAPFSLTQSCSCNPDCSSRIQACKGHVSDLLRQASSRIGKLGAHANLPAAMSRNAQRAVKLR